jgi:uncharacterized protein (DUF1697 family)
LKTWIALLRGINVSGTHTVPMKDLVKTLTQAGLLSVRTYIQSGNVVFQSTQGTQRTLGTQIAQLMEKKFGFRPAVMMLSDLELSDAINGNPFPKAIAEPKSLHLCFLSDTPSNPDFDALTKLRAGKEAFALKGKVFYLHTPDGYGNSKLAAKVERALGVATTCRNWRTANQLFEMSEEIA